MIRNMYWRMQANCNELTEVQSKHWPDCRFFENQLIFCTPVVKTNGLSMFIVQNNYTYSHSTASQSYVYYTCILYSLPQSSTCADPITDWHTHTHTYTLTRTQTYIQDTQFYKDRRKKSAPIVKMNWHLSIVRQAGRHFLGGNSWSPPCWPGQVPTGMLSGCCVC